MSRREVRFARSLDPTIHYQADERPAYQGIPPFYYSGEIVEGPSGIWYPSNHIRLLSAYVAARVQGTDDTTIKIEVGDHLFEQDGIAIATLILPATAQRFSTPIEVNPDEPPYVSPFQWIRCNCTVAGGHEDVTVQLYSKLA